MLLKESTLFFDTSIQSRLVGTSPIKHYLMDYDKFGSFRTKKCKNLMYDIDNNKHHFHRRNKYPLLHLKSELSSSVEQISDVSIRGKGIGIEKFFQGKNIFITGATGLLGKAIVEKLLRSTDVGKIYLLIKAEEKETAIDRLTKQIIDSDLFECLREKHGSSYQAFVRDKLVPIAGNICEPNLGMDTKDAQEIMNQVDILIGSAACTTFDERYDVLIDTNVSAPQRMMRFAKTFDKLKLFVYISTAYVAGRKEGLVLEKPLIMGENGYNNNRESENELPVSSFSARLDVADEISLIMKLLHKTSQEHEVAKHMRRLGLERANYFGWSHTYQMTKAIGEMVLNEIRGDVPLLVIRPSTIESCCAEPFPGWIQGNRMLDPVIISFGKGEFPAVLADPQGLLDIIPLDLVVNTTIAAIAKHGMMHEPRLNIVYHAASADVNPLQFSKIFEILHEYFTSKPSFNVKNIRKIEFFHDLNEFSEYTRDAIRQSYYNNLTCDSDIGIDREIMAKKLERKTKAVIAYAEKLGKVYQPVGFAKGRFHTGNTQKVLHDMSEEEKRKFNVDAADIDWRKYFLEVHIPGLEKHVINKGI